LERDELEAGVFVVEGHGEKIHDGCSFRPPPSSFLKMELLELELVMVSRVAKRVPPSCSLFDAHRVCIV